MAENSEGKPVKKARIESSLPVDTQSGKPSRGGKEEQKCPYLGTIDRYVLDFDFEKLCSVCLGNQHVYCCLVCGKYYQGRGKSTHAYTHALEMNHYVFINLHDCKVYCLPDNYEVKDASLDDIKYNLNPKFTRESVESIGSVISYGKSLDGSDFLPGCIGLNNLKATDFFNVVVQMICEVIPLRNALLLMDLSGKQAPDPVLMSVGELIRKMYNPKNFKGIVSPHEFLQAVGVKSGKKFKIGQQEDPLALFTWILSNLHKNMRKLAAPHDSSPIHDCFRGEVIVSTHKAQAVAGSAPILRHVSDEKTGFLILTLDLPNAPIFKDSLERNIIPQVPIFHLLQKFDGEMETETTPGEVKKYNLWKLPPYLVFHIKRFSKNNFFVEKNPTIVTFPIKNLDLKDYLHPDAVDSHPVTRYDLVANVCHIGKPQEGFYKIYVLHHATKEWYELEDLRVTQVLAQQVALSESYIQLYQRQDVLPNGKLSEVDTEDARMGTP